MLSPVDPNHVYNIAQETSQMNTLCLNGDNAFFHDFYHIRNIYNAIYQYKNTARLHTFTSATRRTKSSASGWQDRCWLGVRWVRRAVTQGWWEAEGGAIRPSSAASGPASWIASLASASAGDTNTSAQQTVYR